MIVFYLIWAKKAVIFRHFHTAKRNAGEVMSDSGSKKTWKLVIEGVSMQLGSTIWGGHQNDVPCFMFLFSETQAPYCSCFLVANYSKLFGNNEKKKNHNKNSINSNNNKHKVIHVSHCSSPGDTSCRVASLPSNTLLTFRVRILCSDQADGSTCLLICRMRLK